MKRRLSKSVWGWALYDWANSAFATTVMAGFFPVFFKMYWSHGANVNESTALLGFGNSAASLLVAITAPLMGSIADRSSGKKKFLIAFAYLGALTTASLYTVGKGEWALSIFFYMLGIVGFSGANIFYDALLPGVSTEEDVDFISGLGFSLGYLGGGLLFALNVLMTLFPQSFGLPPRRGTALCIERAHDPLSAKLRTSGCICGRSTLVYHGSVVVGRFHSFHTLLGAGGWGPDPAGSEPR